MDTTTETELVEIEEALRRDAVELSRAMRRAALHGRRVHLETVEVTETSDTGERVPVQVVTVRTEPREPRPDGTLFRAVCDEEGAYAMWPLGRELPPGWRDVGKTGTREEVLAWIREVWTDPRNRDRRRVEDPGRPPTPPWRPGLPLTLGMLRVVDLPRPEGPVPEGLKVTVPERADREASTGSPVLRVGDFTLWPMSYLDNRDSFGMVMYDRQWRPVAWIEARGARYIERITLAGSGAAGTVTFWGQGDARVAISLDEIATLMVQPRA